MDRLTREMQYISQKENINIDILGKKIAEGSVVIPANKNHKNLKPVGIGGGLTVKVNANIGASPERLDLKEELKKLAAACEAGADTVMDLTITERSGEIDSIRKGILEKCHLPLGTVPIYQAAVEVDVPEDLTLKTYLKVFEKHAKDGVDFATVHSGVTKDAFPLLEKRLMAVVSRGGSFMLHWMKKNKRESFLFEYFDEILDIAKEYDVTLSLGDGLRPGCIADATDEAQMHELKIISELAGRSKAKGVQVIIEGPGHIPLNEIEKNVKLEKELCGNAPFYILGPLPLDTAAGYDHVAGAIGGALAAWKGADFLCYLTPKEHIGLPDAEEVREGVTVTKIAAVIADIARGNKRAINESYLMSEARKNLRWDEMANYALAKKKFNRLRLKERGVEHCSMCGEYCALKIYKHS